MSKLEKKIINIINKFNNIDKKEAYRDISLLREKYPNNKKINSIFLESAVSLKDYKSAILFLKEHLKKNKDNKSYLFQIYQLLIRNGSFKEALIYLDSYLDLDKNNYEANRDKSYILYQSKEYLKANKFIDLALNINSMDYFGLNIKGLLLMKNYDFSRAIFYFEKAIEINSEYVDSYNNAGVCLLELENIKDAFLSFKKAFKKNKNNILTLINLGNILSLLDKNLYALNFLKRALNISPNNSEILTNIAICYCRKRDIKMAKSYFEKVMEISPNDNKLKYAYSTLNLNLNQFDEGWKYFDSRLLIEKNKKKLINFNSIKNNLFKDKEIDYSKKTLILKEQGIGEEILFSSIYPNIIENFKYVRIESDKRLVNIFNKSFKKKIFYEEGYYSNSNKINKFESVMYAGSLLKLYKNSVKDFKNTKYILTEKHIVDEIKKDLSKFQKKIKIGISWKSKVSVYGNLKSLSIKDFEPIFGNDRLIVNLQYGDIATDLDYLIKRNKNLIIFNKINLFNDIEYCMGLLKNLDIFVTVSNSTAHFAGALGVPTILLCPKKSSTYYYWNVKNGSSIWYKSIKVLGIENSVSKTIVKVNELIEEFNDN